jgi:hypothetical protein
VSVELLCHWDFVIERLKHFVSQQNPQAHQILQPIPMLGN